MAQSQCEDGRRYGEVGHPVKTDRYGNLESAAIYFG